MSVPKIGDIVQFLHHVESGVKHDLVVIKTNLHMGEKWSVNLIDQNLNRLETIPCEALKLVKGVNDDR